MKAEQLACVAAVLVVGAGIALVVQSARQERLRSLKARSIAGDAVVIDKQHEPGGLSYVQRVGSGYVPINRSPSWSVTVKGETAAGLSVTVTIPVSSGIYESVRIGDRVTVEGGEVKL